MSQIKRPQPNKGRFKPTKTSAPPPDSRYPLISLRHLKSGKYCLTSCDKRAKAAFAEKVRIMTKMTWSEIKHSGRHQHGFEFIDQLTEDLPKEAPDGARPMAFRFDGKAPMVGYRAGDTLYVVWFDPKFKLYNHG